MIEKQVSCNDGPGKVKRYGAEVRKMIYEKNKNGKDNDSAYVYTFVMWQEGGSRQ